MSTSRRAGSWRRLVWCSGRSWSTSHLSSLLQLSDASFIQNKRRWQPSAVEQLLQALGRGRETGDVSSGGFYQGETLSRTQLFQAHLQEVRLTLTNPEGPARALTFMPGPRMKSSSEELLRVGWKCDKQADKRLTAVSQRTAAEEEVVTRTENMADESSGLEVLLWAVFLLTSPL